MPSGRRPNAQYLPNQGTKGSYPINFNGLYGSLNDDVSRAFFQHYMYEFSLIAQAMVEWENLPDRIPPRFINWLLFTQGFGAFTQYMGKYVFMQATKYGPLDMYYQPTNYTLHAPNGISIQKPAEELEICRNNPYGLPLVQFLAPYAQRMAEIDAAILVNLNANKTPILIQVKDIDQKATLMNAYAKHETNCPVIFELDNMGIADDLRCINTGAPWLCPDLNELKRQIRNEALTFMGVLSEGFEKKERILSQEIENGQESAYLMRLSHLNSLKDFTDRTNEHYNLNIAAHFSKAINIDNILGYSLEGMVEGDDGISYENNGLGGDTQPK